VEPGSKIKLEQVLLLAEEGTITVGAPIVKDNPVWTKVIEHFKGKKVTIFNYSPKKRIRVKTGHRQNYTRLFVEQVGGTELVVKEPAPKIEKVKQVEEPKAETKTSTAKGKKETKPAEKAAPPKVKATTKKPAAKPAGKAGKTEEKPAKTAKKPAKTEDKPAKTGTKKPAASDKKPTAKK